ncbi:glycoside hydrolase [Mycena sp. CBHHK59/15]|nr:glycoside hydrolase [Mycena sp. CBHHK59/15]
MILNISALKISTERDAMGADEYHPISHRGQNLSHSVDAIDTMLIMGLHEEYSRASQWIRTELTFDRDGHDRCFNTFETTIRVLGGLLAAYHLSSDDMYLRHAVDLADRMLPAFDTPSGIPLSSVDLAKRLEYRYLAQLTQNSTYWHKAEKVMSVVNAARLPSNLAPISMNVNDGTFSQSEIRLGSRGDSYYEYLLKQYLQTTRTEPVYKKMYEDSMQGIHDNLLTYIAELYQKAVLTGKREAEPSSWDVQHKQDHLVCFLAGSLMLGATTTGALTGVVSVPPKMDELSPTGQRDWNTGAELLEGCMATHKLQRHGLSPEIAQFQQSPDQPDREWHIKGSRPGGPATYDARYMLRPETVESLFIAWRLTGDVRYRDYSWAIFSSIEKHCRLPGGGYATVVDVDTVPVRHDDKQETFSCETLKYLFLTFSDASVLPLDEYVLNTEAHPLPIFRPTVQPLFS